MTTRKTTLILSAILALGLFIQNLRADVSCSATATTCSTSIVPGMVSGVLAVVNGGTNHSSLKTTVTVSAHAGTCNFATAKKCVVFLQGTSADTLTFTGAVDGETYQVTVIQPTGSDGTVTWPATVYWPGSGSGANTPPALTTTDATCDMVAFDYNGVGFKGEYGLNYAAAGCTQ